MDTWIALIRGINVGGHNRLPMKELSRLFRDAGCTDVKTYIQSGNVVFRARVGSGDAFADGVSGAIEQRHGFRPAIRLLTAKALRKAIASNPYTEAESEPSSLHLVFLESKPQKARIQAAHDLASKTETFTIIGRTLYLHAPEGIGRSKLAKEIDKALGRNATSRNWRTVTKLAELASSIE